MNTLVEPFPSEQLLHQCAIAWNLSDLIFIRKMENVVYSAKQNGKTVYLRLTSQFRRRKEEIRAEIDWMIHLKSVGVDIPTILPHHQGDTILSLNQEGFSYEAVLFSAIAGSHPQDTLFASPTFLRKLGTLIAKMHEISKVHPHHFQREAWSQERGIRHALLGMKESKEIELIHLMEKSLSWMNQLPQTKEYYGLIHADLGAMNLFYGEDESISIIDFDDSCYHFFMFDLAIALSSITSRMNYLQPEEEWLRNLTEGYQSIRTLSDEEISWIPKLCHFASLRLFFWIEHHLSLGTFHDTALDHVLSTRKRARERALSIHP